MGRSGRLGACPAIQVFLELFTQSLVFISLVPSFPGTQRRGTLLSWKLSTSRGGWEVTGILIRSVAQAWGGATPSLFKLLAAHSLDFLGELGFSIWTQETSGPAI